MDTVNLVNKTCNEITNKLFNSFCSHNIHIFVYRSVASTKLHRRGKFKQLPRDAISSQNLRRI